MILCTESSLPILFGSIGNSASPQPNAGRYGYNSLGEMGPDSNRMPHYFGVNINNRQRVPEKSLIWNADSDIWNRQSTLAPPICWWNLMDIPS